MKTVTVTVQIQLDIPSECNVLENVVSVLGEINQTLYNDFKDSSPVIFTSSIDDDDILGSDDETDEE